MSEGPMGITGSVEGRTFTVAAVARRLGVAPATLRTWARRYGLGPTDHTAGSHRRYGADDLARLVVMRRLTHEGLSPAQAAQLAMSDDLPAVASSRAQLSIARADIDTEPMDLGDLGGVPDNLGDLGREWAHPGGGRVVALPEASPAVRGLARAAMALDARGVSEMLRRQIRADGVIATWNSLAVPVLTGLGDRYAATGEGVEVEHLFSECLMGVLRATSERLGQPRNTAAVLLACLGEEQHSLPLHAIAAALAERGVLARQLGGQVPGVALTAAARRSGSAVVVLFASMPVANLDVLNALARLRPVPRVLVGGPGWPAQLPATVTRVREIGQTVSHIVSSVLSGP